MALSLWQLAVKYAFHFRITFLRTVTSTKTHYCLSFANFILSTLLAQKSWPCLLVCTTAASIGSLYCFFILPNPPFHFNILKYHPMEIVSPVIPALRRQPRIHQPELQLITWNRRKSSLEPSSHLQSHSENSHNCFFLLEICNLLKKQTWLLYKVSHLLRIWSPIFTLFIPPPFYSLNVVLEQLTQHQHHFDYHKTSFRIRHNCDCKYPLSTLVASLIAGPEFASVLKKHIYLKHSSQRRCELVFVFFIKPGRFDGNGLDLVGICRLLRKTPRCSRAEKGSAGDGVCRATGTGAR